MRRIVLTLFCFLGISVFGQPTNVNLGTGVAGTGQSLFDAMTRVNGNDQYLYGLITNINLSGGLLPSNNLSDVANSATALSNIGGAAQANLTTVSNSVVSNAANLTTVSNTVNGKASQANLTIVSNLTNTKITGNWVNVWDYGATNNNTGDQASAFSSAVSAVPTGGTLLVPPGTYAMATWSLIRNDITIVADGATIKCNSSTNRIFFVLIQGSRNNIVGLKVDGNSKPIISLYWDTGSSDNTGTRMKATGCYADDTNDPSKSAVCANMRLGRNSHRNKFSQCDFSGSDHLPDVGNARVSCGVLLIDFGFSSSADACTDNKFVLCEFGPTTSASFPNQEERACVRLNLDPSYNAGNIFDSCSFTNFGTYAVKCAAPGASGNKILNCFAKSQATNTIAAFASYGNNNEFISDTAELVSGIGVLFSNGARGGSADSTTIIYPTPQTVSPCFSLLYDAASISFANIKGSGAARLVYVSGYARDCLISGRGTNFSGNGIELGTDGTNSPSNIQIPFVQINGGAASAVRAFTGTNINVGLVTGSVASSAILFSAGVTGNRAISADSTLNANLASLTVNDDAYDATAWNGSTNVPTKNAVRDKIESLSLSGGSAPTGTMVSDGSTFVAGAVPISKDTTGTNFTGTSTLTLTTTNASFKGTVFVDNLVATNGITLGSGSTNLNVTGNVFANGGQFTNSLTLGGQSVVTANQTNLFQEKVWVRTGTTNNGAFGSLTFWPGSNTTLTATNGTGNTNIDIVISSTSSGGGFDITDPANAFFYDEFGVGGRSVDGTAAMLGWFNSTIGGGYTLDEGPGEQGHPGIHTMTTAAVAAGDGGYISLGDSSTISSTRIPFKNMAADANWTIYWIFKLSGTATIRFRAGVVAAGTGATIAPANWMGIRYDTGSGFADTQFVFATVASSTASTANLGAVNTSWHKFRMRSTSAGTILGQLDAGSEQSLATNVPTNDMTPFVSIETDTTAARTVSLDYFSYKITGLTR